MVLVRLASTLTLQSLERVDTDIKTVIIGQGMLYREAKTPGINTDG